jgi:hypothetical protein
MEARGLPSWRGARDDLVAQRDNPEWDVWVLDDEATGVIGVIGQTVVQRQGPSWGGRTRSVRSRLFSRGRSRILAVRDVLEAGDRGLETVGGDQPGLDQRRLLV